MATKHSRASTLYLLAHRVERVAEVNGVLVISPELVKANDVPNDQEH